MSDDVFLQPVDQSDLVAREQDWIWREWVVGPLLRSIGWCSLSKEQYLAFVSEQWDAMRELERKAGL